MLDRLQQETIHALIMMAWAGGNGLATAIREYTAIITPVIALHTHALSDENKLFLKNFISIHVREHAEKTQNTTESAHTLLARLLLHCTERECQPPT